MKNKIYLSLTYIVLSISTYSQTNLNKILLNLRAENNFIVSTDVPSKYILHKSVINQIKNKEFIKILNPNQKKYTLCLYQIFKDKETSIYILGSNEEVEMETNACINSGYDSFLIYYNNSFYYIE
jgi:hypothetical protein